MQVFRSPDINERQSEFLKRDGSVHMSIKFTLCIELTARVRNIITAALFENPKTDIKASEINPPKNITAAQAISFVTNLLFISDVIKTDIAAKRGKTTPLKTDEALSI